MTPKRAPQRIALMTLVCILLEKHECAVLGNGTLAPLHMRPAGPAAREAPAGCALAGVPARLGARHSCGPRSAALRLWTFYSPPRAAQASAAILLTNHCEAR